MKLTDHQIKIFDTFGYLVLPGILKDSADWIIQEFHQVFSSRKDVVHDGSKRTMFPLTFIDQNEKLCTLLDDPRIVGICKGLLGDDFLYEGGDGNFYSGDTGWHSDNMPNMGMYKALRHIKIAFYLDPLTRDTGALRVIPGSHIPGDQFSESLQKEIKNLCHGRDIPSVAFETKPGDLAIFNHNLQHASYGGGKNRRMFTMNLCAYAHSPEQIKELETEWQNYGTMGATKFHSEIMIRTASPERMQHLKPLHSLEPMMAEYARKANENKLEKSLSS